MWSTPMLEQRLEQEPDQLKQTAEAQNEHEKDCYNELSANPSLVLM